MINRSIQARIIDRLKDNKAIIILGPRQVGKTTLLDQLFSSNPKTLWLNGDEQSTRVLLENVNTTKWKQILGKAETLIIDEAQRIQEIGLKIKLITDQINNVKVILSGSSAFELKNQINEPLTGRKWEYELYPFSFQELSNYTNLVQELSNLENRLVFGCYPEVVNHSGNAREYLESLAESYLFKDIFTWQQIKKPEKLLKLLQAIAFQVGNEVSYNELGNMVGLDNQTVENYITTLERAFVIFRLQPLSMNLRKELKTKRKIYFYDNGIRNAIIAQFSAIETRTDIGALWENYFISERLKMNAYNGIKVNTYFWRTSDQQEIDYIEFRDGVYQTFELKWNPNKSCKLSKTFASAYPNNSYNVINRQNYFEFLLT
ncbi:MAG: ATP-binding protein [Salibacteraceae bacterium]|jgi:uncharacterized protein|nr:ATP-binding protein [Salibacteraceae bacterium]MDP4687617.1 ATP-binding protein [Salibacteraceae bacterium]MDP4763124.1 ATP-binding protein [Salibacteraceae bacterium]MDP4845071.1 ATP-binding protein [Salibacteraceae bacterium]MDP4965411.1 ATP-binding protein [Salibacteraceae bacterium]